MPYSGALWMAASLLWILDAANNVTMEPYRAFVSDRLDRSRRRPRRLVELRGFDLDPYRVAGGEAEPVDRPRGDHDLAPSPLRTATASGNRQ